MENTQERQVKIRVEPRVEVDWEKEELLIFVHLEAVDGEPLEQDYQIVPFSRALAEQASLLTGLSIDWENRTVKGSEEMDLGNAFTVGINEEDLFEEFDEEEGLEVDCD